MKYSNRRYIGNKNRLCSWIFKIIKDNNQHNCNYLIDIFAGTGAVGFYFLKHNFNILLNDILYHNYVIYKAFTSKEKLDENKLKKLIKKFNDIKWQEKEENYLSKIYGNKYFTVENAYIIGSVRDKIDVLYKENYVTENEKFYLIAALIFAADRSANTVGHYESFLKKMFKKNRLKIEMLHLEKYKQNVELFNDDANSLIKKINEENSILYLDPPYNGRQYINFYHVLENIAVWNKPTEFEGISMKFKRNHLKSEYSKSNAKYYFEELIKNSKSKLIVLSYNNTYKALSSASNNKIAEEDIISILSKMGEVKKFDIPYKVFNSGKTNLKNHKECLYVCFRRN